MAKKDKIEKAPKAAKAEATTEAEKAPEFKYGVKDVAEAWGVKEASARVRLRTLGIKKAGKSYGWNTRSELQEVVEAGTRETKKEKKAA